MSSPYQKGRPFKYNTLSKEGKAPFNVVGEYRIKDLTNMVVYVGITNQLKRRMKEHMKTGKINDQSPVFEWMPAKSGTLYSELREHEKKKINQYKSPENQNIGGGGNEPKYMVYYDDLPDEVKYTSKRGIPKDERIPVGMGVEVDNRSESIGSKIGRFAKGILIIIGIVVILTGGLLIAGRFMGYSSIQDTIKALFGLINPS